MFFASILKKTIIEAVASLRFAIVAITGPHLKVLLEEPLVLLYKLDSPTRRVGHAKPGDPPGH
jgi:hypothetical protein